MNPTDNPDEETGLRVVQPGARVDQICIYRVPHSIRKLSPESYDPVVITIGPFHDEDDERYRSMKPYKERYYNKVLRRSIENGVGVQVYLDYLRSREAEIRQCYSEILYTSSNDFVNMLLVDSFFIIELFLCDLSDNSMLRDDDHGVLTSPRLRLDIEYDLILLENQIPFFVLQDLYNLALPKAEKTFLDLTFAFFSDYNEQDKEVTGFPQIKHFTDLILQFHWPDPVIRDGVGWLESVEAASVLKNSGVRFQEGLSNCLLDITFKDGVLEIPQIKLHGTIKPFMQNLLALEHCHYENGFLTDYCVFMDCLVDTSDDIDLLVRNGILDFRGGSQIQTADLFNNLMKNIVFTPENFYFSSLCVEVNLYAKSRRNKWFTSLKRNYFNSPWRTASTCAAIMLLFLTLTQTILSVIEAAKGKSRV